MTCSGEIIGQRILCDEMRELRNPEDERVEEMVRRGAYISTGTGS
jgi:hypothetical protein